MTDYETGTIVRATVRGVPDQIALWSGAIIGNPWFTAEHVKGYRTHLALQVTDAVVLQTYDPTTHVLLDPNDDEQVTGLASAFYSQPADRVSSGVMKRALKRMLPDPVPGEPTSLSVRVSDCEGYIWAQIGPSSIWYSLEGSRSCSWYTLNRDLGPVTVVSE